MTYTREGSDSEDRQAFAASSCCENIADEPTGVGERGGREDTGEQAEDENARSIGTECASDLEAGVE